MNAIEIRDLCKKYDGFSLDHLNLTLPGGCIMGLIGENGAGKSTTIRLILEMLKKDGGTIRVMGEEGCSLRMKQDIGVVLDNPGLPSLLNAKEIGRIMRGIYENWDDAEYERNLNTLAVPKKQPFYKMSNGMKMKLALAAALSHHAKLLILDEATNGLDPLMRDELMDTLRAFVCDDGHAVLISSHIVSDLEKVCDYVAFLHGGKLLLCEEKDRLREIYGVLHCSAEALAELPPEAVCGCRVNAYGAEAVVRRDRVPSGTALSPVDIEQLFILLAQETKR